MDMNLLTLTTAERIDDRRFRWTVADGWQQGRGAFGGLVVGTLARTAQSAASPGRRLRSLTAHLCGPVLVGEAELILTPLREGKNTQVIEVRLELQGELAAHAVVLFGDARSPDCDSQGPESPVDTDWRELELVSVEPPLGPVFGQHFEYRFVSGAPYGSEPVAASSGWIRPKNPGPVRDEAYLACCIDAWWPASLTTLEAPRPFGTATFTFQTLAPLEGLDPDLPLFHREWQVAGRDGYLVEQRELWGADGRLLATNQQSMVLIR